MSERYKQRFARLRAAGKKAFIPFTLLGWPDREQSLQMVRAMIDGGATALELGWAFSDPIADGRVIQRAAFETLALGFKVADALDLIACVRELDGDIPIGLLVYYNMVLAQGARNFFLSCARSGVDGVLVADVPPEAADEIAPYAAEFDIDLIFIVSPLTTPERLDTILSHAGGFIYAVSRLGITGVEERYDSQLAQMLARVRAKTDLPVCVGFGVSTPEQAARMIEAGFDGVITGSRIIEIVDRAGSGSPYDLLLPYLRSMVDAVSAQASA